MPMPILTTKLYIPEMRVNHVFRGSLVEKLACGIRLNNKLSLVSAPAGYGKTTLVLELLKSMNLRTSWISLDEGDNDLTQFLLYFIAALKKAGMSVEVDTERLIFDLGLSTTHAPMTMIINDVAFSSEKIILVLDDFHLINSLQVYDSVKFLLEHQPPNLHLIIITREDPLLPLPQLRVQQKMTEIRMEDLCFTWEETKDFLKRVMELELSDDVIKAIASRTEGWIAGLQLAGLSLNGYGEHNIDEFIKVFNDTHRYIIDYLVEEVINCQTPEMKLFLCQTSILDRMNGGLCDAITGKNNSKQLLREIERANLFLIPLDSKREWYRYHQLFADSLRAELNEKEEQDLQRKSALWLNENGFKQEAVKHVLKSGDMPLALKFIEENTEQAFKNAHLTTLVKWMDSIPENLIKGNDILAVRKAWALFITGKISEATRYLLSLGEDFFSETTPHNKGLILSLQALLAQRMGKSNSEVLAQEALKFLESWDPISRISTLNTLARAQEMRGSVLEAHQTYKMAYGEGQKLGYTLITTLALANLGVSLNAMGRRKEALEIFIGYIEGMTKECGKPLPFIGLIYIALASLYAESHDLIKAKDYVGKGIELCHSISYNWAPFTQIIETRIQFALGEKDASINKLERALKKAQTENATASIIRYTSVLTELLVRSGNIQRAEKYEEVLANYIKSIDLSAFEEVTLSYARLLIYKKLGREALSLLDALEKAAIKKEQFRELIAVYILCAEAHFTLEDVEKASEYLDKAVVLAEPQDYYHMFLADENIIKDIIARRKKSEGQFLKSVLEYLELTVLDNKATIIEQNKPEDIPVPSAIILNAFDKLSQREVEILNLLGKGLSNNEIAKNLYISTNTAQWHISHIYSKLGVKSRTQAVLKARELGVL